MNAPPVSPAARTPGEAGPAWHTLLSVALATLGVFLPYSTAGVSISIGALLLLALARPRALWRLQPWREPVVAVGLALLAYIALHTLWTTGFTREALRSANRYHELLLLPLLLVLLHESRHRLVFIRAFMLGAVLLALVHWVSLVVPSLQPLLVTRRISAGLGLALCAFIVLLRARGNARPWPARALAGFLALTVLFAIEGRTGHMVVLVLVAMAAWLHSPPRWRWAGAIACPVMVLMLALSSGAVGSRLQETLAGSKPASATGEMTSTGIRIEILKAAGDLARQHAALGVGFANYAAAHETAARARYAADPAMAVHANAHWVRAGNPHNEYLMQLIGGGAVSLALFVAWLGVTARAAARAPVPAGGMLAGAVVAFAVGSLFNSLLMDFVEAHLYIGLLAWLLAEHRAASMPQAADAGVRTIVVIATRQIGDVLLTTPVISAARQRWPDARIDVLGFRGTMGMLRGNPHADELIETPPRAGFAGNGRLLRRLWRRYDLALITDPGDRAHLMGWIAAPRRSGIVAEGTGSNWLKKPLLAHLVTASGDLGNVHVTAEKLSLLDPWRLERTVPTVIVPQGAPLPPGVQAQLASGAVVVHAPSMWPYKQWPLAHFEALVTSLLAQGRQVVLTGSNGERDQACVAPLRRLAAAPRVLDLSGRLDFNQLVTLFRSASLYIGPDTSVSHLAAATGVPVIAIFGPTNPLRWAPWPAASGAQTAFQRVIPVQQAGNVTVMQGSPRCVPCGKAGCEDHRQSRSDCLVSITPEQVLAQVARVLADRKSSTVEASFTHG